MYEVPAEVQPQMKKFATDWSKLNSSVYGESKNKNHPAWNPKHSGQWNSLPNPPNHSFDGLILLKIEA